MKSEDSLMFKIVDFFLKNTCWIFFFFYICLSKSIPNLLLCETTMYSGSFLSSSKRM